MHEIRGHPQSNRQVMSHGHMCNYVFHTFMYIHIVFFCIFAIVFLMNSLLASFHFCHPGPVISICQVWRPPKPDKPMLRGAKSLLAVIRLTATGGIGTESVDGVSVDENWIVISHAGAPMSSAG